MEEPNAQQRKNLLHVLAYTNIVTAKAREVFYNNGINLTAAHTIHHLLETRSIKR